MGGILHLTCLIVALSGMTAATTPYMPCANNKNPIDLRVKDCTELPCNFVQGSDVIAEVDFLVEQDSKTLKPEVKAETMGMSVDYNIKPDNACESLTNGECPLDKGEEITYRLAMDISMQFPKVDVIVQLSLIDEHGSALACFKLPGRVVPPPA